MKVVYPVVDENAMYVSKTAPFFEGRITEARHVKSDRLSGYLGSFFKTLDAFWDTTLILL